MFLDWRRGRFAGGGVAQGQRLLATSPATCTPSQHVLRLALMKTSIVVLVGLLASVAFGQDRKKAAEKADTPVTWNGLHFGTTPEEVKRTLRTELTPTNPEAVKVNEYKIGEVHVENSVGVGSLAFGKSTNKLESIYLNFSRHEQQATTDEIATRIVAYDNIADGLLEKYGTPANETGKCPTHSEISDYVIYGSRDTLKCVRLWKEKSQTIKMDFAFIGPALFLSVEYKSSAVNSGL